ncbi:hypothetical protein [Nocardioides sp. 503]|uniref:hypothetical protein n=1 Tax=Nocardioides sp. 503 TaxID=2508326 RepID=UPI0010705D02|nr:hypothetical protein [Nocardioides sp. 503]
MGDLSFASYLQGPLGEAISAAETFGDLPPPTFSPGVTLLGPGQETDIVRGPDQRLLGPGDVAGLPAGAVTRSEPPPGACDVEPNYLASVEVTPAELPWLLTPARPTAGRLRPWLVLVVLEAGSAPLVEGAPLPAVEAPIDQLPDLRDSWAWAHVQRTLGDRQLPAGASAPAAAVARLLCPRHLDAGVSYRACLVPAFASGRDVGLGMTHPEGGVHEPAWQVTAAGSVRLPVYHHWTFTTGPLGDFEDLVGRLGPADPAMLRVSSTRPVDVRQPWPGDGPVADDAQMVGVEGALRPFSDPPAPESAATAGVLADLDARLARHLDAPAQRVEGVTEGEPATLSPPLYGARHVLQQRVGDGPPWVAQLNLGVARRIAAGLGASYVRDHQEDLMQRAWQQVGAIREANRLRSVVELTTEVAQRIHERHVSPLTPGETLAFTAPAQARTRTSDTTTLSLEMRVSRLSDGVVSAAFRRRVRPAGKLARRSGVSVSGVIPRGLVGEVAPPMGAHLVPTTPMLDPAAVASVVAGAAADQLMMITAMATVASLADPPGAADLDARIHELGGLSAEVTTLAAAGRAVALSEMIAPELTTVTEMTGAVLSTMVETGGFGTISSQGVAIPGDQVADRVTEALRPGDSHWRRLGARTTLPDAMSAAQDEPVMTCPSFPVPAGLALLESDPEWFLPGLGALPGNKVALLRQNSAFIESYLVGLNHELMRELLWREYPTDQRGTPFTRFWPRPDGSPDIEPIATWTDDRALGDRLLLDESLAVLLVRGDVVRRYPSMIVTAVPSDPPDDRGRFRPSATQPVRLPLFVISVDAQTNAYAFDVPEAELLAPASTQAPGWFFVFAENSFRVRFGFDVATDPPAVLDSWNQAVWPPGDGGGTGPFVPVVRGHAVGGVPFGPPAPPSADGASWDRDAADIARISLQRPFRVAMQADVLLGAPGTA